MSKNQIIAKAMLCGLGFYAVYYCLSFFPAIWIPSFNAYIVTLIVLAALAAVILACRVLIFNSDKLAEKLSGSYQSDEDFDRAAYLVKAFRITFVTVGLYLITSPRTIFWITRFTQSLSLPKIRMWIRHLIQTGDFQLSGKSLFALVPLLTILLAVYLICGGAFVIKWHLRKSCLNYIKELSNE